LPPKKLTVKRPTSGGVKKKPSPKKQEESIEQDFTDLMKEGHIQDEQARYHETKYRNLIKLQELQDEMRKANQGKRAKDEDIENEEAFENYFENQMLQDMQGISQYEQEIDYFGELKKIEGKLPS
jgi:hypothetical protein